MKNKNKVTENKTCWKIASADVNPENPWEDDLLNRKKLADCLTQFLDGEKKHSLVVSLHGAWGTGKTFFLRRWQAQLKNEGFQCIFFNAWEDDFIEDPLVSLIGQLYQQVAPDEIEAILGGIKLPPLRKTLIAAITERISIDPKDVNTTVRQASEEYKEYTQTIKDFKKKMAEFAEEVQQKGHPLIFIIDELDRCRPTYAIALLERIKHLFDIPHIMFVLGVDMKNLKKSICSVYGDIDVDNYLHRFFDMNFRLPKNDAREFVLAMAAKYEITAFFEHGGNVSYNGRNDAQFFVLMQYLAEKELLTLRING